MVFVCVCVCIYACMTWYMLISERTIACVAKKKSITVDQVNHVFFCRRCRRFRRLYEKLHIEILSCNGKKFVKLVSFDSSMDQ